MSYHRRLSNIYIVPTASNTNIVAMQLYGIGVVLMPFNVGHEVLCDENCLI